MKFFLHKLIFRHERRRFLNLPLLLLGGTALLALAGMGYLLSLQERLLRQQAPVVQSATPTMIMTGLLMRQYGPNGVDLEMLAEQALVKPSDTTLYLDRIDFKLLENRENGQGQVQLKGRANQAAFGQQKLSMSGQVLLSTGEGIELTTEKLDYDQEHAVLTSPGEVRIQQGHTIHQGSGLLYEVREERLTLQSPLIYR